MSGSPLLTEAPLDVYKRQEYQEMSKKQFSGILTLGGTILGTSRQPFRNMRVIDERGVDKVAAMKKTYKDLKLD